MTEEGERRLSARARQLLHGGPLALRELPTTDELASRPETTRRDVLDRLRVELYAISSIIADGAIQRARDARPEYPPYGLVRSMYSQLRMVVAAPKPFEADSITDFRDLGKAFLDTLVFQLDRELKAQAAADRAWMLARLEELLGLFRVHAGPATRARFRDGFTFLYGGLHFGTSVSVQMVEVMTRLLGRYPELSESDTAAVISRSIRPAYQLAAVNVEQVVGCYQRLLSGEWMDPNRFTVQLARGRPWRVEVRDEEVFGPLAAARRPPTFTTQKCPARTSPAGGPSAIAGLWAWCVELARELNLLRPVPRGHQAAG